MVAIGSQIGGSTVSQITGNITLSVNPDAPFAGRDISFTLRGLAPWQEVVVEFIDPLGQPAEWITEEEAHVVSADGTRITERSLYADDSGEISWLRLGTQDREGVWTSDITIDGRTTSVTYAVSQLQLQVGQETLGVDLRRYQGLVSNTLYSSLVPAAVALDLQSHLGRVVEELRQRIGVQSRAIPNTYLAGNRQLFEQIAEATGTELGFEQGYYQAGGEHPGIYMRADDLITQLEGTLTHEYVHLAMDELARERPLPAWLTEGLARFYEYEIGLAGQRPNVTRWRAFRSADLAREAANSGALLRLPDLESRAIWNGQTDDDRITLQYAEAYMAVRYMTESYGADAAAGIVGDIGGGFSLVSAIQSNLGVPYSEFEQAFIAWLRNWEDPERLGISPFIEILDGVLDMADSISQRRGNELGSRSPRLERIPFKTLLHSEAAAKQNELEMVTPPDSLADLHLETLSFLGRYVQWLALELEFVETGVNARIAEANNMIGEINVREVLLARSIGGVKLIYNLQ